MIFYFSGCGNSRHVAETLARGLNDTLVFIPDAAREGRYHYTLADGESLGFVFPIYAWGPAPLVLDFIRKLDVAADSASGPSTAVPYLYFACTCGDECGLAEKMFRKAVRQKGWSLDACFSLRMPETYIGMRGFKLDTEENAQRKIKVADGDLECFMARIANRERFSAITVGAAAWLKSRLGNPGFSRFAADDRKYHATNACIHCGKCVEVCPLRNITLEAGRPVWHGHCTICMACYHHCPVNAIHYGKATWGKGQYYYGK